MTQLIVDEIEVLSETVRKEIRAQVVDGTQKDSVWFRWKGDITPVPGDVLFCAALIPAMKAGRNLVFKGQLSRELTDLHPRIQSFLAQVDNDLRLVEVEIKEVIEETPAFESSRDPVGATLFNGDIDAFYTLLLHRGSIRDLVFLQGSEAESGIRNFKKKMLFKRYAAVLDKKFIEVETNADRLFEISPKQNSGVFSPASFARQSMMMVILGLIFSGRFDDFYFPIVQGTESSFNIGWIDLFDPLFKPQGANIIKHGSKQSIEEKINAIVSNERFMEALRTCWENPYRNYNCGRCATCSRNEDPRRIVKRLGSDEYAEFTSSFDYVSQTSDPLRN